MTTTKKVFEIGPEVNGTNSVDFEWSNDSNYICVASENGIAYVLDKRGKKLKEAQIPKKEVLSIDWDKDNEIICILQDGLNFVTLWQWGSGGISNFQVDNARSKASFAKWSKVAPVLAVGTDKGSLIFENRFTQKKIPTMGKHSKKITMGCWNSEGQLITVSEDRLLTISGPNGETIGESFSMRQDPTNLRWVVQKSEDRTVKHKAISAVFGKKAFIIYDTNNKSKPSNELTFDSKYGKIVDYQPFGDGYFIVTFDGGYYNQISSHERELGVENYSERVFGGSVEAMAVNDNVFKLAVAGEGKIKFINLSNNKENKAEQVDTGKSGRVVKIRWSESGQNVVYLTSNGYIAGLLTMSLSNFATYQDLMAVCTSATEVSVYSTISKTSALSTIEIEGEANNLGIGPRHLAVQHGNVVRYYSWLTEQKKTIKGGKFQNEREYVGQIKRVLMNRTHAVVMTDGRTFLHAIEGKSDPAREKKFPVENDKPIIGIGLTKDFLIILDSLGRIRYYNIEDDNFVLETKPDLGITKIFPNKNGTRLIAVDNKGQGFFFQAASETFHLIKDFPDKCERVLWDLKYSNEFVAISMDRYFSFLISRKNIFGRFVGAVRQIYDTSKIMEGEGEPSVTSIIKCNKAISFSDGLIYSLSPQAVIVFSSLTSHSSLKNYRMDAENSQGHLRYFLQNISLHRFPDALLAAQFLKEEEVFQVLGKKAIENQEVELAIKAFQLNHSLSMVLSLQNILHISDKYLLTANCAMLLNKYDVAQEYFKKSTQPVQALDLRCDIQDWAIAMSLSKEIAPEQEVFISRKLAGQLEAQGNNSEALKLFQRAIITNFDKYPDLQETQSHNTLCKAGVARCCVKIGDTKRGYGTAREITDPTSLNEIAQICENMKQYLEAADLYERAGNYEKGASTYLQLKMYEKAAPLMQKVQSAKVLIIYAKAKESERNYKEAEAAYEKAESWEDVVRINLTNLDNLQKPREVLRSKCSTITIATLVANYCVKRGLFQEAVEYLLLANKKEEAEVLAQSHDKMEVYVRNLRDCSNEQRIKIAQFYEGKSKWVNAAEQYQLASQIIKAQKLLEKAGENHIDKMIALVVKYKNENLQQMVLDYIMGEHDGTPKDAKYAYQLYKQLGNYKAASRIAITIATEDQEAGRYKKAHTLLFQTFQDIRKMGLPIPNELQRKLLILHSYTLVVKTVIKLGEHEDATYLLQRVCNNLSLFPKNVVKILTTAFVEAQRANLKSLAYEWAVTLLRSEYKDEIKEELRPKIENVARKPVSKENKEKKTPCPFCGQLLAEFNTDCPQCQNSIPFCVASGKHVLKEELTFCPQCQMPANLSYLRRVLEQEKECPMCCAPVQPSALQPAGEGGLARIRPKVTEKEDIEPLK